MAILEMERRSTIMEDLPEACIARMVSYAASTPEEVCRLSLVSKLFCRVAESDYIWNRFIPSDLLSIIPRHHLPSSASFSSKKALFLALSHHPIIIHRAKKSFQLDRRTGKKCCMLSARDLSIIWGETPQYWNWTNRPDSRFEEVAGLRLVWWFEIRGRINTLALSSNTQYAAFLVFKMIDPDGFDHRPVELSVGIFGDHSSTKLVCLDPNLEESQLDDIFQGLQRPNVRSDGWLEMEMGEFFISDLEGEVEMSVRETDCDMAKHGFFLEGIELRPKM